MRNAFFAGLLLGSSTLIAVPAVAQTAGPADLCQELLAYVDKSAKPPQPAGGKAADQSATSPLPAKKEAPGRQGGGSVSPSTSTDTSSQGAAPPTAPATTGAAPEAASSPHATDTSKGDAAQSGPPPSGSMTMQQVRDTATGGNRQACRDAVQNMRRAGAELPAALIALAAYEPDPAKRR